jgi:hypothetical protein
MRFVCASGLLVLALLPRVAEAQSPFNVQAAAGVLTNGGGTVQSVSLGYSPNARFMLVASGERNHVPSEVRYYENGYSASRGGTLRFVTGELRVALLPARRISPYVLAGLGKGVSRPNVNALFPDPVKHDATSLFFGAGVRVGLGAHLALLGDARLSGYGENGEVGLLAPIRAGVAWRF